MPARHTDTARRPDLQRLGELLRRQDGVVTRGQVLELGGKPSDIRCRIRRREWAPIHPGVYVDHTGPPTESQRAWAAVLSCWPAALHRESALAAHGLRSERRLRPMNTPVQVMVDASQAARSLPGVQVERVRNARNWFMENRSPPVAKLEFALLKVASGRDEAGAVAVLADACQQGRTTPDRLARTLERLPKLPMRALMLEVLRDVAKGAYSVLERRYLRDVERAHGLPSGQRQTRACSGGRVAFRDVRYAAERTLVELDGRLGHEMAADQWADLDRDLAAALDDELTVRVSYGQVLQPCRLAAALGGILAARGWNGAVTMCGPHCGLHGSCGFGAT